MPLFKFVYTAGALTEGDGNGGQKAHQDLAFLVIDVILLFAVRNRCHTANGRNGPAQTLHLAALQSCGTTFLVQSCLST